VRPDTMDSAEQDFMRQVGGKAQQVYLAVYDQALEVKDGVSLDFVIRPEWREQLYRRLQQAAVPVTRQQYDEARPLIDRMLEQRIAGLAFDDSAAFRRFAPYDAQLRTAVDLLQQAQSQTEIFAIAGRRNAQRKSE
jgi:carboxyl-terminal processing protease